MKKTKIEPVVMASSCIFIAIVLLEAVYMLYWNIHDLISSITHNYMSAKFFTNLLKYDLDLVILCIGYLIIAIGIIFAKKFNKFPIYLVGFGIITVRALCISFSSFIGIFKTIINGIKYHTAFLKVISGAISSIGWTINDLCIFLAFVVATALVAIAIYVKYEEKRAKFMKMWFVPAVLLVPDLLQNLFHVVKGMVGFFKNIRWGLLDSLGYIVRPTYVTIICILLVIGMVASMMFVTGKKFPKKVK